MGAELGSMRVTEQIDAMEVSATNPFKFLVASRITASTLMLPLLMAYSGFVGMMGAYLNVHQNEMTSMKTFFQDAFARISFLDIFASVFKSLTYGFTIGVTGCYIGYHTTQGTQGVGKSANSAVGVARFLMWVVEMIIVQIVNTIRPPFS